MQKMHVYLREEPTLFSGGALPAGSAPAGSIVSRNFSNCWAVGPRIGMDGYALLPMGFRVEGDFAGSLLYTNYTNLFHTEDVASTAFNPGRYDTKLDGYSAVRPMFELGLGLGWGGYFSSNNYHFDFAASYDFTMMWNQNMMRRLLDTVLTGTGSSPADLYFHGLTLTGRFDF
jgi:hypothetical protein